MEKENFLRTRFVAHLQRLDPATPPQWGRLSVQGMIEHFAGDALRNANGRLVFDKLVTPPEHLEKTRAFMLSEKPFRPNTKNPLMSEEAAPLQHKTVQAAIGALQEELIHFFQVYEREPAKTILNPFFGELNFEQNVHLLHKHAVHHLRQFGLEL
jgi:hypothetical protein